MTKATMEGIAGLSVATSILGISALAKYYEKPVDFPSLRYIDPEADYVRVVPVERKEFLEWMRGRKFQTYRHGAWLNDEIEIFDSPDRISFMRTIRRYSVYNILCVVIEQDNDILSVSQYNSKNRYGVEYGK